MIPARPAHAEIWLSLLKFQVVNGQQRAHPANVPFLQMQSLFVPVTISEPRNNRFPMPQLETF